MSAYSYYINKTEDYHTHHLDTLGWELTVCNALWNPESPCRKLLQTNDSFGCHLHRFLQELIPVDSIRRVLEVGGGMGYLMRDLLDIHPDWHATMLDISPHLLAMQKKMLADRNASFIREDFLALQPADLRLFDFVILNENLGDFPTLVAVPDHIQPTDLEAATSLIPAQIDFFQSRYDFAFAPNENINIGALKAVDHLCRSVVGMIYLSEHSCEARAPEPIASSLKIIPSGNPERIPLKGHAEYTLKFSHLQRLGQINGYRVVRGPLADFLVPDLNSKVLTALRQTVPATDEQEIIQQFIYDLYKYEYLVMIRQ